MGAYTTINPATGEAVAEYPIISDQEVDGIIERAHTAYLSWRETPLSQRTAALARAAQLAGERIDDLAKLLTLEMGKPLMQAQGEVMIVASIFQYYAENAEKFLADELLEAVGGGEAVVRTEPIGVILGVMPWNFPYYQVARFAAPNLALGNTIILKHAHNCPQSALAMEQLLHDAGIPKDAYINAFIDNRQVAEIVADPRVQGVSLTGSEKAGSAVGEVAGRHMKRYVLELGGSDPFIVLEDADIDAAVQAAVMGRVLNAGQACTASKRFIVVDSVYEEFAQKFIGAMTQIPTGDPADPSTLVGPLSSADAAKDLGAIVQDAVDRGAQLHSAPQPQSGGAFYAPAVLTGVTPEMRAFSEELFGPVATVYRVPSPQAAVELANSSPFGLGGSIFTKNLDLGRELAASLETGMVWINAVTGSSAELPFGGVKRSGVGRELGKYGMSEFANKKLVRVPQPA